MMFQPPVPNTFTPLQPGMIDDQMPAHITNWLEMGKKKFKSTYGPKYKPLPWPSDVPKGAKLSALKKQFRELRQQIADKSVAAGGDITEWAMGLIPACDLAIELAEKQGKSFAKSYVATAVSENKKILQHMQSGGGMNGSWWAPGNWLGGGHQFAGNQSYGNKFAGNMFGGNQVTTNPFAGNAFTGQQFAANQFAGNQQQIQNQQIIGNMFTKNLFSNQQKTDEQSVANEGAGHADSFDQFWAAQDAYEKAQEAYGDAQDAYSDAYCRLTGG
jgi:hypothetical protein